MKELEELKNKMEEMQTTINELKKENEFLEYQVYIYDCARKEQLKENYNQQEKNFIEFLEENQNDLAMGDFDFCNCKLKNFSALLDEYIEYIAGMINEDNIKTYFNYERHTN